MSINSVLIFLGTQFLLTVYEGTLYPTLHCPTLHFIDAGDLKKSRIFLLLL